MDWWLQDHRATAAASLNGRVVNFVLRTASARRPGASQLARICQRASGCETRWRPRDRDSGSPEIQGAGAGWPTFSVPGASVGLRASACAKIDCRPLSITDVKFGGGGYFWIPVLATHR